MADENLFEPPAGPSIFVPIATDTVSVIVSLIAMDPETGRISTEMKTYRVDVAGEMTEITARAGSSCRLASPPGPRP